MLTPHLIYGTKVDTESNFNDTGVLTGQKAVLKDKNNNTLREIPSNTSLPDETARNFDDKMSLFPQILRNKS